MNSSTGSTSKTFVLVHGASHGGWCYDRVADLLRAQGHRVSTPTLPGLAERFADNRTRRIDLTDHVDNVVKLVEREDLRNVCLCGHSNGGMVISGVAERVLDRIHHLVFIDAVVSEDGKRMTDYVFPGWRIVPVNLAPFADQVQRWTTIPTCVGIGPTKTLANVPQEPVPPVLRFLVNAGV